MDKNKIPVSLENFIKNGKEDCDDGYEYASELNRILNSDICQQSLKQKDVDKLREFADEIRKIGEFNNYTKDRIKNLEKDFFGSKGMLAYLNCDSDEDNKKEFFDLFKK